MTVAGGRSLLLWLSGPASTQYCWEATQTWFKKVI